MYPWTRDTVISLSSMTIIYNFLSMIDLTQISDFPTFYEKDVCFRMMDRGCEQTDHTADRSDKRINKLKGLLAGEAEPQP